MNFIKKTFTVVILFILSISCLEAQKENRFASDTTNFIEEFNKYIEDKAPDETKELLTEFNLLWNSEHFLFEKRVQFIKLCNLIDSRGGQPTPHFNNYLKDVIHISYLDTIKPVYDAWENGLLELLNDQTISIINTNQYLKSTYEFFINGYLYYSSGLNWQYFNADYTLSNENYLSIHFRDKVDIKCYSKTDSLEVYETTGKYSLYTNLWKGKTGIVTWERAGYSRDSVNAKLDSYQINMKTYTYTADSVLLTHKYYLSEPSYGQLEDRVMNIQKPEMASYPRFDSYDKFFRIKNLFPNINFEGGLLVEGANIIGTGTNQNKAFMDIYRNDSIFFTLRAKLFIFSKNMVNSEFTEASIYFKDDSIYHPSINFSYSRNLGLVSLFQSKDLLSQAPYINSYHKINITVPQITWKQGEESINLTMPTGTSQGEANFKSYNFFDEFTYDRMQGMDYDHPLQAIYKYSVSVGSEFFHADDFAGFVRKEKYMVYQLLMYMNVQGFVVYDRETHVTKINPSLYNALKARAKMIDYDVINFISLVDAPDYNAKLNLNDFDIKVHGIPMIQVSDSQNVAIFPRGGEITIKKNRNFQFDGIIKAGLFTYYGIDFEFDYETFSVDMPVLDSLTLVVPTDDRDLYGKNILAQVNNTIEQLQGKLYIDNPENKSGLQNIPQFPIFQSTVNSFIYYDDFTIHQGVYKRENFYFEVYPYTIDSLDNFNKSKLTFDGMFHSANIFAPFEEKLRLRDDNSLGFIHDIKDRGVPVYEGKGTFYQKIDLSNKGLRASGDVEFLTSKIESKDYLFFPDSMKTIAENFEIKKYNSGISYPQVNSKNNRIKWLPKEEEMLIAQIDSIFNMFNDSTRFTGNLRLNPIGLTGNGKMYVGMARMNSDLFEYESDAFEADSTDFLISDYEKDKYRFISAPVKARIDFSSATGTFNNRDKEIYLQFPENDYISFVEAYNWEMKMKNISIKTDTKIMVIERGISKWIEKDQESDVPFGSKFISTRYDQDSLSYISPDTDFNLNNLAIKSHRVAFIDVADIRIIPVDKEVMVLSAARMTWINNAEVFATRETRIHRFYDSKIKINGKNNYYGTGYYDYIDENFRKQTILFDTIYVDKTIQTIAEGKVLDPDNFTLNPKFQFQGNIRLNANDRYLNFSGGVKSLHLCNNIPKYWLKINDRIIPDSIYFAINEENKDINNYRIYSGSYIASDSIHIYPSFLSKREDYYHTLMIPATGYLHYDKNSDKFKIGSLEKITNPDIAGNYINLHSSFCYLHSEGKADIGIDLGRISLNTVGNIDHDVSINSLKLDVAMPMDFHFPAIAHDFFANDLDSLSKNNKKINLSTKKFTKTLLELLPEEEANEISSNVKKFGTFETLPKELNHTIFFSDVKFKWVPETNAYISEGPIGILSIGDKIINKYFEGKIEIIKKNTGNRIHIFIELDRNNWYMFAYYPGVFQTLSSNTNYHKVIKSLKSKERKIKGNTKLPSFNFMLMTETKKVQVLESFEQYEIMDRKRMKEMVEKRMEVMRLDSIRNFKRDSIAKRKLDSINILKADTTRLNLQLKVDEKLKKY